MPAQSKIMQAALGYAGAGIPVFPCNKDKSPRVKDGFKSASTDTQWIEREFVGAPMIGIPMGEIVCLDIDAKHKAGLVADFEFCMEQVGLDELLQSMPKQTTPTGGGAHYLFRTSEEIRNKRLACNTGKETIIETRGKGGYICVYPSTGYQFERGGLLDVPMLTKEQIESVLDVARSFSEIPLNRSFEPQSDKAPWQRKSNDGDQPGDHYNQRGDICALLRSHGWASRDDAYWTRPGKSHGISATLGRVEGKFYVFSSNANPFEPETSYSPFAVYAVLEHGGDFSAATKSLRDQGFGGESELPSVSPEFANAIQTMIARKVQKERESWMQTFDTDMQASIEAAKQTIEELSEDDQFFAALDAMAASNDANIESMQKRARDAVFVLPDIALAGDSTIINASPNTGKTLLTLNMLTKRPKVQGHRVYYINADDSFNGSIEKMKITKDSGITTLIPNEGGFTLEKFGQICKTAIVKQTAGKVVFVLDTLKKFCSTMDKKEAREFGSLVRFFTQAGGTVIALAHTNKNKDSEGKSVAEGVGDFEADFDCAYTIELLTPKDAPTRQVAFENRKLRGPNALKVVFEYDASEKKSWHKRFQSVRRVGEAEALQASAIAEAEAMWEKDSEIVEYLLNALSRGPMPRTSLMRNNLGGGFPGSAAQRGTILDRYDQKCRWKEKRLWGTSRTANGGINYYLLSDEDKEREGNLVKFNIGWRSFLNTKSTNAEGNGE